MDNKIQLPTLKKVDPNKPKKKKILLLSDDLRLHSGIATQSKELVLSTLDKYDWVQLGAALKHPDQGKVFDISVDAGKEAGVDDAYLKVYANTGYGNPEILRELINIEKPDAILHFTDPRFWKWLYDMEMEVRQIVPISHYQTRCGMLHSMQVVICLYPSQNKHMVSTNVLLKNIICRKKIGHINTYHMVCLNTLNQFHQIANL